jgi:hypothetical protein
MIEQHRHYGILATVERMCRLNAYQGYAPYGLFVVDEDVVADLVSNKLLEDRKAAPSGRRGLRLTEFGRRVLETR